MNCWEIKKISVADDSVEISTTQRGHMVGLTHNRLPRFRFLYSLFKNHRS